MMPTNSETKSSGFKLTVQANGCLLLVFKPIRELFQRFQILRYGVVGVVNTLLYGLLLWLLIEYSVFPYFISNLLANVGAMLFHYFAHRIFTFRSQARHTRQVPKYLAAAALNYAAGLVALELLLDYWQLSNALAVFLVAIFCAVIGYLLSRFWVYRS